MRDIKGSKRKKTSLPEPERKERKRVDVPPEADMIAEEGVRCPRCHCRHMPAVRTYRTGLFTVRKRACRHCGHVVTTSERIASTDPDGTP